MYVIVWRYEVAPAHAGAFRAAYGPDGDWARLFAQAEGFLGVELYEGEGGTFVTLDQWRSEPDFEAFKVAYAADYAQLDRGFAHLSLRQRRIGAFETG